MGSETRRPVELVYQEEYEDRHEALSREYRIKRLSRQEKLALICGTSGIEQDITAVRSRRTVENDVGGNLGPV